MLQIVQFIGAHIDVEQIVLVTEFMPRGDLWHALSADHDRNFCWAKRCLLSSPSQFTCMSVPRAPTMLGWFFEKHEPPGGVGASAGLCLPHGMLVRSFPLLHRQACLFGAST